MADLVPNLDVLKQALEKSGFSKPAALGGEAETEAMGPYTSEELKKLKGTPEGELFLMAMRNGFDVSQNQKYWDKFVQNGGGKLSQTPESQLLAVLPTSTKIIDEDPQSKAAAFANEAKLGAEANLQGMVQPFGSMRTYGEKAVELLRKHGANEDVVKRIEASLKPDARNADEDDLKMERLFTGTNTPRAFQEELLAALL